MTSPNECAFAMASGPDNLDQDGLTKREYFASAVLQGLLAGGLVKPEPYEHGSITTPGLAVRLADLLIEELNAPSPEGP